MEKIKTTKNKKIIETITHYFDNGLRVKEILVNGKKKKKLEFLCSKKEFSPVFLKKSAFTKKAVKEYENFYSFINKHMVKIESVEDVDKYDLYFSYSSGWKLFDENMKPVSIPYIFDYIGSLKERFYDDPIYKKIIELLKKHPAVLELEEEIIPNYNEDFSGQRGLKHVKVLFPQGVYEKLYEKCKGDKERDFSVKMHESFKMCSWADYSIYGKEISALFKEFHKRG